MSYHTPVLLREVLRALAVTPDGIYFDGTVGGGGHSEAIARVLTSGHLFALDRDEDALAAAGERLAPYADRVTLLRGDFRDAKRIFFEQGVLSLDGALLDLGVSSHQLDDPARGFSYHADAPLDMRMDRSGGITAADVINTYTERDLSRILSSYGEERYSARIARAIVRERAREPITSTARLAEIIRSAVPPAAREDGHPARRSFQAIRIEVNRELDAIEPALCAIVPLLREGARLAVITFHSLEDRAVKRVFAQFARGCTCPPDFPVCVCGGKSRGRALPSVTPGQEELAANPRARSARLRVFEKHEA